MIRIIGRTRALIAVFSATCLVVAGCGSGPSQVSSAAIVGDRSVPLGVVQQEISWLLNNVDQAKQAQKQRKFDNVSRQLVRTKITHELTSIVAAKEGLHADESQVSQLIDANGGPDNLAKTVGVEPKRAREFVSDYVLQQELAKKYLDRLSVSLTATVITDEQVGSTAKDKALGLGHQMADNPAQAANLAASAGGQVIDQPLALAEAAQAGGESGLASSALFGAKAGTVVVIQPGQQQSGWLVALIKNRDTGAAGQPNPAAQQVQPGMLAEIGIRLLQPVADDVGVRINPRYGVWDASAMSVAANENELTGYQLPARNVQP